MEERVGTPNDHERTTPHRIPAKTPESASDGAGKCGESRRTDTGHRSAKSPFLADAYDDAPVHSQEMANGSLGSTSGPRLMGFCMFTG